MATTAKTSTELNLVNWHGFSGYEGTGEGGLFAYAVWSLGEIFNSLSGPVLNSFPQLTSADVLTGIHGAEARRFQAADQNLSQLRANAPLDGLELEEYRTAPKIPVAVFLGATDSSLFSEYLGEYFSVDALKLTEEGERLIDALEAVYGPATFLTFLDT